MFGKKTESHFTKIEVEFVAFPIRFPGGLLGTVEEIQVERRAVGINWEFFT